MIGIDALGVSGNTFGIHNYADQLVRNILPAANDQRFTIYCRRAVPGSFLGLHPEVTFRVAPFRNRKLCEQLWLPYEMWGSDLSVYHATYGCPLYSTSPLILTVHDVFMIRFPERYPAWLRLYGRLALERPAHRALAIITPSEATRKDVIKHLRIPPAKVTTIPMGVDLERFRPASQVDVERMRARHRLPDRFFLHVGGFSPIKNTVRLVEAFSKVCKEKDLADIHLVFAGMKGWTYSKTVAEAQKHRIGQRVIFTGYFPQADLSSLYSSAEALVYPSIIEGFGFPILEGFACGTAVITSNCTALPEVAGDAAVLVDPFSVEMLAESLMRLARWPGERALLQERGLERARSFTWRSSAEKHLELYRRVMSSMS